MTRLPIKPLVDEEVLLDRDTFMMTPVEEAEFLVSLGNAIARIRAHKNRTIESVCLCTRIRPSAYWCLERGRTQKVSIFTLNEIAKALRIELSEIFREMEGQEEEEDEDIEQEGDSDIEEYVAPPARTRSTSKPKSKPTARSAATGAINGKPTSSKGGAHDLLEQLDKESRAREAKASKQQQVKPQSVTQMLEENTSNIERAIGSIGIIDWKKQPISIDSEELKEIGALLKQARLKAKKTAEDVIDLVANRLTSIEAGIYKRLNFDDVYNLAVAYKTTLSVVLPQKLLDELVELHPEEPFLQP